jgi:hypothetical protein
MPRTWRIFRLPDPFPAARVALRAWVASDLPSLLQHLSQSDAVDEACFLREDCPRDDPSPRASSARLLSWDGTSGTIEHDGTCDLILIRTFDPGWLARVGAGPERPVFRIDAGLQAIHLVGSGVTRVSLRYEPSELRPAAALSLSALSMIAVSLLASIGSRYRSSGRLYHASGQATG